MDPGRAIAGILVAALLGATMALGGDASHEFLGTHRPSVVGSNVTWALQRGTSGPPALAEHALAYDVESDRLILFGGYTSREFGETWAYDADADTWTNLSTGTGPPARSLAAMAYAVAADRVILFGGQHAGTEIDDTWAYDFNANTWTNLNPSTRPLARTGHAMAYDELSDRVILFGGYTAEPSAETWAYEYGTNTWSRRDPPASPSARGLHGMVYDSGADRIVLFGGSIEGPGQEITLFRETWTYDFDSNLWQRMDPLVAPSARAWAGIAFDAAANRTVLFGGLGATGPDGETWTYDEAQNVWSRLGPVDVPAPRAAHALGYDRDSDRVVLHGGRAQAGPRNETWHLAPAPPDVTLPLLSISTPTSGAIVWSSTIVLQGSASDDRRLARIEVRSDISDWALATGTTTWTAVLTLPLGGNTIRVRAIDSSGNVAVSSLTVTIIPLGTFAAFVVAGSLTAFAVWFLLRLSRSRRKDPLWRFR